MKGKNEAGHKKSKTAILSLFRKVALAAEKRSTQVDSIISFLNTHTNTPSYYAATLTTHPYHIRAGK